MNLQSDSAESFRKTQVNLVNLIWLKLTISFPPLFLLSLFISDQKTSLQL